MHILNMVLLMSMLYYPIVNSNDSIEEDNLRNYLQQNGINIEIPKNWKPLAEKIVDDYTSIYPPNRFDGGYTILKNDSYYPLILIRLTPFKRESDSIERDRLSNLLHNYFQFQQESLMVIDSNAYNPVTNEDFFNYEFVDTNFNLDEHYFDYTVRLKVGANTHYEVGKHIVLKNGNITFYSPFDSITFKNYSDTILDILQSVTVDKDNQIIVFQGRDIKEPESDDIGILKKIAISLGFLFLIILLLYKTIMKYFFKKK